LSKAIAAKLVSVPERVSPIEKQLRQFIAHIDVLTEKLLPIRRPQDLHEPECSQRELKVLAELGQRNILTMSDLAAILKVPLSTATHTVDKLVAKNLVERKRVQEDRRVVQVTFSGRGRRINQFVLTSRLAAGRRLLEPLDPSERRIFLQRLAAVAQAAARNRNK
jgi:DNA-binding MarR family transcriptional regulator